MSRKPLVSVNVRIYNSGKTLFETLLSVKRQTYNKIEIVISDGYSTDKSIDIAKAFNAKISYSDNLGDARFQNYKNSIGKYIISLDSDQVMDRKLIEACVDLCENKGFDALIISEKTKLSKGTFLEKLLIYDKWVIDQAKDIDTVFGTACPRFFRKDLLKNARWPKKLGIFDDTILFNLLKKNGAEIKYVSNPSIRHYEVTNWITFIKKFHRYGKSYFVAFRENPKTVAGHSLLRRSYFYRAAFSKPHYFLGLLFIYIVKVLAAISGVISYFFESILLKPSKNKY